MGKSQVRYSSRTTKVFACAVVLCVALACALGSTFAWTSITQTAKNEAQSTFNPGARLHDDFNGSNKDVYVENYGQSVVYARVRLLEYMETGPDAGINIDEDTRNATPVVSGANIEKIETWIIHGNEAHEAGDDLLDTYWDWTTGGKTVYMPTFNKNKDSLQADINGTFAGPDKDPATEDDRFADYVHYEVGNTQEDEATYDADDSLDNGDIISTKTETHTAKETLGASVITMATWVQEGGNPGEFWVLDTDGWFYWAQPLQPNTATGTLLTAIAPTLNIPDEAWYYSVVAEGQFVTKSDIAQFAATSEDTGVAINGGITDAAKELLITITGDAELFNTTNTTNSNITNSTTSDAASSNALSSALPVSALGELA